MTCRYNRRFHLRKTMGPANDSPTTWFWSDTITTALAPILPAASWRDSVIFCGLTLSVGWAGPSLRRGRQNGSPGHWCKIWIWAGSWERGYFGTSTYRVVLMETVLQPVIANTTTKARSMTEVKKRHRFSWLFLSKIQLLHSPAYKMRTQLPSAPTFSLITTCNSKHYFTTVEDQCGFF